jgi:superfamily II DNA or RNA helicase/HKD family nuclease
MDQVGIYEKLVTQIIRRKLDNKRFFVGERRLEAADAAVWLTRTLTRVFEFAVESIPDDGDRLEHQIDLANQLIIWLKGNSNDELYDESLIESPGYILTAIFGKENPISPKLQEYEKSIYPLTGLSQSELFSGANAGISLEAELKREILSSDKIYWLVSFIKWSGLRIFKDELEAFAAQGKKIKVITTSYMGATEAKAIDFLASLPNAEVRLSYNVKQERLHAKSYMFIRETGFHTGYIGSSNLSHSALTNGLEWNLKITSQEIPHIVKKTINTFDTYWESAEFEPYSGKGESKEKLLRALDQERSSQSAEDYYFFDLKPYPHQLAILERLAIERELHGRNRNLVVAATGTGKTLISAFDFQRFYTKNPLARLLFVAHREEILIQARSAYQLVLRNRSFGELWVGGHIPNSYRHLFVSVQTLNSNLQVMNLTSDFYDYVVIDEVHHVIAASYRRLIEYFRPKILMGLTATPERMDGSSILPDFDNTIAAEIRLPEAINQGHLCPFQYFGIDDGIDLSSISWRSGRYDISELSNVYTNSDLRAYKVISTLIEIVSDVGKIRGLAFCVNKAHAEFMASKFNSAGIPADFLTSDNSSTRSNKRQSLVDGKTKILCVVDIFNEGIDIPEIDTLLFLRPTESLTVFLQQLGRGLRLPNNCPEKQCCTVLDFVGNARPEYDFSSKFRALIGRSNTPIKEEIEKGFPHLPLGCGIKLERKAQENILKNIQRAVNTLANIRRLIASFSQSTGQSSTLENFLRLHPNVMLEDIYKFKNARLGGWTWLSEQVVHDNENRLYEAYYRAIDKHLLLCNSKKYLSFLLELCASDFSVSLTPETIPLATMAHYNFWNLSGAELGFEDISCSLRQLRHAKLQKELIDVLRILIDRISHRETDMPFAPHHCIKMHSRYSREQILAGFGASTFSEKSSSREGVLVLKDKDIELLFVTLDKSEKHYSPTTLYHDFAISHSKFHWQTQNSARPDKGRGLSYVQQNATGKIVILFVREKNEDENRRTMGFVNYGEVEYLNHNGSQPMSITWRLKAPMPSQMWHEAAKLAVG